MYKAKDSLLDRDVALKVFNATDKGQYTVIEEIKKAIRLHHPHLLRYYDVAVVENTNALGEMDTLQIGVMELANAGDLKQFARRNPQSPMLFTLLRQVLSGLEYLHQKGIIHRDLKPQNILLVEDGGELTARISDFGISKSMDSGTIISSVTVGSIEYMAPEQFNSAKYGINGKLGTNVDLWSFGIMLHELVTNETLFGQRGRNITTEQIMSAILSDVLPPGIDRLPEPYRTIVKKCLIKDAKLRVQKANEILKMLDDFETVKQNENHAVMTQQFMMPQLHHTNSGYANGDVAASTPNNKNEGNTPVKSKSQPILPTSVAHKKPNQYYLIVGLVAIAGFAAFLFYKSKYDGNDKSYLATIENAKQLVESKQYAEADKIFAANMGEWQTQNDTVAMRLAAPWYAISRLGVGDTTSALPWLEKGAATLDKNCLFELGSLYYLGHTVSQDYDKALALFKQAATAGEARSQAMLGNMYFMGQGVETNYNEAIRNYYNAANQGNSVAMYALGLAYLNGAGVPKNEIEARKWFLEVLDKKDNAEAVKAATNQLQSMHDK